MPLTDKGEEIKEAMTRQYGEKKGEKVFYASANKGIITGVDSMKDKIDCALDKVAKLDAAFGSLAKKDGGREEAMKGPINQKSGAFGKKDSASGKKFAQPKKK